MIPFNVPPIAKNGKKYLNQVIKNNKQCGDGAFTKKCHQILQQMSTSQKVLLTTSCTHALEMAAMLIDIKPGDEVIMPSYTFVSTANAFVLRGAKIVFVDIRPDTMNIDESLIEAAITSKTKAIVPVHYAGVACDMDVIMDIANRHNLFVIEDAAQGVMSAYKNRPLGSIGHFGAVSFHETKNYSSGEGGALYINDPQFIDRAEIIREKGTNRSRFFRGQVDKYTWVDTGSSYLPSEFNAAFLFSQLEMADKINNNRLNSWNRYHKNLVPLKERGLVELPVIPEECTHNAHMFYIKCRDITERQSLIEHLDKSGIKTVFHYIPLHSSPYGIKCGQFFGRDDHTTKESERLLRLPMYYGLKRKEIDYVCLNILQFYKYS